MEKENINEFIIEREFRAPKELLFKVFTEAEHLNNWWGPPGVNTTTNKLELRPGGTFHYCMQLPDGNKMYGKFIYKEIIPNEKLVFISSFSNEKEDITRHPMSNTWPLETLSTILFTERNGKTLLTLKGIPINASDEEIKTFLEAFAGMNQGWTGTLNQLEEYLLKIK